MIVSPSFLTFPVVDPLKSWRRSSTLHRFGDPMCCCMSRVHGTIAFAVKANEYLRQPRWVREYRSEVMFHLHLHTSDRSISFMQISIVRFCCACSAVMPHRKSQKTNEMPLLSHRSRSCGAYLVTSKVLSSSKPPKKITRDSVHEYTCEAIFVLSWVIWKHEKSEGAAHFHISVITLHICSTL